MSPNQGRIVQLAEVYKHDKAEDCWVVLHGVVYDLTEFVKLHPGGAQAILTVAGTDATKQFAAFHTKEIVNELSDSCVVGVIAGYQPQTDQEGKVDQDLPPIQAMMNTADLEAVARRRLRGTTAIDYIDSAADDEVTHRENGLAFDRVFFRPKILVNVKAVDTTTSVLGWKLKIPLYCSSVAANKQYHNDGELAIARACKNFGVPYLVPMISGYPLAEIAREGGRFWFQLYSSPGIEGRKKVEERVRQAEALGGEALFVTVDSPHLGRRERDPYFRNFSKGVGGNLHAANQKDAEMTWETLEWFRAITKMKLVLKGIQRAEDAVMAARNGVDAIVISNHGGRQLEFSRATLVTLQEVTVALRAIGSTMPVLVDGGIRRGSDVAKAIALGAAAVGLGRTSVFSLAAYGEEGVAKCLEILEDEFRRTQQLLGATRVTELTPDLVDARSLRMSVVATPTRTLYADQYTPLKSSL
mmetsp:Transcript_12284/g.30684  ORF Transcript_12284/g.30684 Transcript_12284/m.30684 type:complete len:471 (-) Transcript_12284:174-1586(-)